MITHNRFRGTGFFMLIFEFDALPIIVYFAWKKTYTNINYPFMRFFNSASRRRLNGIRSPVVNNKS